MYMCICSIYTIYSRKLSREKTLANFKVLWLFATVISTKIVFFTNSQKFSPSQVSHYGNGNMYTLSNMIINWVCLFWSENIGWCVIVDLCLGAVVLTMVQKLRWVCIPYMQLVMYSLQDCPSVLVIPYMQLVMYSLQDCPSVLVTFPARLCLHLCPLGRDKWFEFDQFESFLQNQNLV